MTLAAANALRVSRERIETFHDAHHGQRAVIVGNGPSLNKMDLSFLKEEVTFGMNRIYLGFEKYNFKPTYYLAVDPLMFSESLQHVQAVDSIRFLSHHALKYLDDVGENIIIQSLDAPLFSRDPTHGVWEGHTVTYVALQLAYYMGFDEIYLIGIDHHFQALEEADGTIKDTNHFHPDYFKDMDWAPPDLTNSEYAYRIARDVFQAADRRVYDATVGGQLDIFPKVNYREVLLDRKQPALEGLANNEPPLVSVIPVGDVSDANLVELQKTLTHQTYPNIELLLPTTLMPSTAQRPHEGLHIQPCTLSGDPHQARSGLIQSATGEYIAFMDPRVSYHSDHLSILAGKLASVPACPAAFTQLDIAASNSPYPIPTVPSLRIGDDVTVESLLILNPIDERSLMICAAALQSAGNIQPEHGTSALWDACIRLATNRPIARLNTVTAQTSLSLPATTPADQRSLYQRHRHLANENVIAAQEEALQFAVVASAEHNGTGWSNSIMAIVARADEAIARKNYALASTLLASAKQSYPDDAFLLNAHGNLVLLMGNAEAARNDFERAVIVEPSSAESHIGLGMALLQLGHISDGLQVIEQAAILEPDNPTVRMIMNEFGTTVNSAQERIIHPQATSK